MPSATRASRKSLAPPPIEAEAGDEDFRRQGSLRELRENAKLHGAEQRLGCPEAETELQDAL